MELSREWLCRQLAELAEPELAAFNRKLIPEASCAVYGVRVPKVRALARSVARTPGWQALADAIPADAALEELYVKGMTLGYARMPWPERWARILAFVPLITNWAVCDCCCSTYTAVRREQAAAWPDVLRHADSAREFDQRFAAVMLMDHFLTPDRLPDVLRVLAAIRPSGYYAAMGVGWAFSACFVHAPEATWAVLQSGDVAGESRRLACRKILESRRTSPEWRAVVRGAKDAGL